MALADRSGGVLLGMNSIFLRFFSGIVGSYFALYFCGGCTALNLHGERLDGFAPARIEGSQLRYKDNHGENFYTFFSGGRFRFATISQNRTQADMRSGVYRYAKTAPHNGSIKLVGEGVIDLEFDSPGSAVGRIEGDARLYRFSSEPKEFRLE